MTDDAPHLQQHRAEALRMAEKRAKADATAQEIVACGSHRLRRSTGAASMGFMDLRMRNQRLAARAGASLASVIIAALRQRYGTAAPIKAAASGMPHLPHPTTP